MTLSIPKPNKDKINSISFSSPHDVNFIKKTTTLQTDESSIISNRSVKKSRGYFGKTLLICINMSHQYAELSTIQS